MKTNAIFKKMADYENWSDAAIRDKLAELGHPVGPITATTRKVIIKKLTRLVAEGKRSVLDYSSADDDGPVQRGARKRNSMPPPASYRRLTSARPSPLNSTVGENASRNRSSVRRSLSTITSTKPSPRKGMKHEYDFDSGSDSDFLSTSLSSPKIPSTSWTSKWSSNNARPNKTNNSPAPSHSRLSLGALSSKDSRPFSSNLSRRSSRLGNDGSNIKESDEEDGLNHSRLSFSSYSRATPIFRPPVFPSYSRRPLTADRENSTLNFLKQKGPYILLAGFIALLLILIGTYCTKLYLRPPAITSREHVYPVCTGKEIGQRPCIPSEQLPFAVNLYKTVHQMLTARAVASVCGPPNPDGTPVQPYMTQRQLVQYLLEVRPKDVMNIEPGTKNLALLLMSNPQWGVMVLLADETDDPPTVACSNLDSRKAVPSDLAAEKPILFIAPGPKLSFSCRAKLFIYKSMYYVIASVILGVIMYSIYAAGRYYWQQVKEEEEQVMAMVERILQCVTENSQQEFLAIRHVHDVLIPPKDRQRMAPIWEKAVEFLDKNESRVRREEQKIRDEEMSVWRVVTSTPLTPPSTPPTTPTPELHDNHLYPDLTAERQREVQRVWQGEAFETSPGAMNSLPVSPTQCLKIRHMFQANKNYGPSWEQAVRDAIIEKCDGARIVHVKVDSSSKEGCVYVKCSAPHDAGEAFKRLHGAWFDGALVTVKYLRLERYHERFPDAVHATQILRPSNNLRLSLGGRS